MGPILNLFTFWFFFGFLGVPWTEEEHRLFLVGLQKLGKGDWRGIARNYVVSRTPTQVASHAQKYFIRQSNSTRRKRRSSLFDMVADMVCHAGFMFILHFYICMHRLMVAPNGSRLQWFPHYQVISHIYKNNPFYCQKSKMCYSFLNNQ